MITIGIDASRAAVRARTGTEQYTVALLSALASLDRRTSYRLYVNQLPAHLPPLGTNFTLCPIPFPRLWTHARLSVELVQRPPSSLFVPAHVLPFPGALCSKLRCIVTIHDLGYLAFPQAHPPAQRLYLRLSTLWSARSANTVIAVSEATRRDLVRHTGIDPARVRRVYHGVDKRFAPQAQPTIMAATARYGIRGPYFLYVGTIQPRKNLERLIAAYAQARRIAGSAFPMLVIAGRRGWLSEGIERRAVELGIAEAIHFTGYVTDVDLPALLSGALAFVYVSLYEGFGMPVLEAMGCGTAVLASNTTSLPEVAGDAAVLVNPTDEQAIGEALLHLSEDASLRDQLRLRGLARVVEWTWERCAQETRRILLQNAE